MVYKARLLLSGRQKIAFALLLLAVGGFLAYYPRVTEALLAFLLGGVVPGTNIVVSPDAVLLLVLAAFIVGFITLVLRMYFKAARGKRNFRIAVQAIESVTVLPVARDTVIGAEPKAGVNVSAAVRKRHAFSMFSAASSRKLRHALTISSGAIWRTVSSAGQALWRAAGIAGQGSWKGLTFATEALYTLLVLVWFGIEAGAKAFARASMSLGRRTAKVTKLAAHLAVSASRQFAAWLLPRLKRLDSWLELLVQKAEDRARKRLSRHETVRTVAAAGREYRKSINDLRPKVVLTTAQKKAVTLKAKVAPSSRPKTN